MRNRNPYSIAAALILIAIIAVATAFAIRTGHHRWVSSYSNVTVEHGEGVFITWPIDSRDRVPVILLRDEAEPQYLELSYSYPPDSQIEGIWRGNQRLDLPPEPTLVIDGTDPPIIVPLTDEQLNRLIEAGKASDIPLLLQAIEQVRASKPLAF